MSTKKIIMFRNMKKNLTAKKNRFKNKNKNYNKKNIKKKHYYNKLKSFN